MTEIDRLRRRFGQLLGGLLWLHVPLVAAVASFVGKPPLPAALICALLAGITTLAWLVAGNGPLMRYVSSVAAVAMPSLLVFVLSGHPWQIDMHMYFFVMLALLVGWCDGRALLLAATAIAVHHLVLNLTLPALVFPGGTDLKRVAFHAAVVAFETAVLMLFSARLVSSFARVGRMSDEIRRHNETLEQAVALRTQEANEANAAKSIFLANMSHEIRTPMNAILGFSHLALRTELTPRQADYIGKIRSASSTLLNLINDILDFSKIEAGKLILEHSHFSLSDTFERAVGVLAPRAAEKEIALTLDIDENLPAVLVGDPLRLHQVVTNLVSNAVKFTERGGVVVHVRRAGGGPEGARVEIEVADTGIGMTPAQIAALFRPFTQADNSTTRKFGGTGLGLTITKQLVDLMGGTIAVRSTLGGGSRFSFTLELPVGDPGMLGSTAVPEQLAGLKVLIVDDNASSREILHNLFANWGVEADLAASGEEALATLDAAAARGVHYDLAMLDWRMPGMDGIEAAVALHERPSLGKTPTVLMVSAYAREEAMQRAEEAGISAFLVKPVDPAVLIETISRLLGAGGGAVAAGAGPAETVPAVRAEFRGLRVLMAEDNEINAEVAREILTDAGLLVDVAVDGREACDKAFAADPPYAAILMDVQMPVMDGLAATRALRERFSPERLPIIAMTAHAYERERQSCFAAGMNDHVSKPIEPAVLVARLEHWLEATKTPRGAASTQVAPVAERAAISDGLPDALPPFDISGALARLNGKRPLLHKLLGDFATKYGGAMAQLRALLDVGDREGALRLAHTLKGVAATLGADALSQVAGSVENALVADQDGPGLDRCISALEAAMTPALAAAGSLIGPLPPPAPASAKPGTEPSAATLRLLNQFRGGFALRNLRARKTLEALEAEALGILDLTAIKAAAARLDFGEALRLTEALQETMTKRSEVPR